MTQDNYEMWDTLKRPNLRVIGIEENEDFQIKEPQMSSKQIIEENFPNLKKK